MRGGPDPGLRCPQACNPKYSDYARTGSICASEGINDTLSRYRWLTSAPAGADGVAGPLRDVDFDTFFTSSKMITLDAVYFQPGSRVQCAARAVTASGDEGLELLSPVVTVAREQGDMCPCRLVPARSPSSTSTSSCRGHGNSWGTPPWAGWGRFIRDAQSEPRK